MRGKAPRRRSRASLRDWPEGGRIPPAQEWDWGQRIFSHWAINTTIRCQHRCLYCFEGDRRGLRDVPQAETKALLTRAAREVPKVIFMGAEPTLNPALPELIRYATKLGLKVGISTNALRLADRDFLAALDRAGLDCVEFSFHYPDAEVYARITRARPSGFPRLLQALENLAAWQRGLEGDRSGQLCANLVVSAPNAHRLDEVLEHLRRRLNPGRFLVYVKCLALRQPSPDLYVTCATLRRVLPRFAARAVAAGVPVQFSDFPLCAIPGWESSNDDLACWLNTVDLKQNFFDQRSMVKMNPECDMRTPHQFTALCADCALSPLCLKRRLFDNVEPAPENRPRPLRGTMPARLRAWVLRQARGAVVLHGQGAKGRV